MQELGFWGANLLFSRTVYGLSGDIQAAYFSNPYITPSNPPRTHIYTNRTLNPKPKVQIPKNKRTCALGAPSSSILR